MTKMQVEDCYEHNSGNDGPDFDIFISHAVSEHIRDAVDDVTNAPPEIKEEVKMPYENASHAYIPIDDSVRALLDRDMFKLIFFDNTNIYEKYLSADMIPYVSFKILSEVTTVYKKVGETQYRYIMYSLEKKQKYHTSIENHLKLMCGRFTKICIAYHMQQSCEWASRTDSFIDNTEEVFHEIWNNVEREFGKFGIKVDDVDRHINDAFFDAARRFCENNYARNIFGEETNFYCANSVDICPSFLRAHVETYLTSVIIDEKRVRDIFRDAPGRPLIVWEHYEIYPTMSVRELIARLFRDGIFWKALRDLSMYYTPTKDEVMCGQLIAMNR